MADFESTGIILIIVTSSVAAVLFSYLFGRMKGLKEGLQEALRQPILVQPSLREVTILGKYIIKRQSTDEIVGALQEWLASQFFVARSFPNVVIMRHVGESEEARKRKKKI